MSYLQRAITRGDINAVRRCLDAGADIETSANRDGDTPLMVAVSSGISRYPQFPGNANKGSNQMAELLLDRGANVIVSFGVSRGCISRISPNISSGSLVFKS